jgi:hypothetical protein
VAGRAAIAIRGHKMPAKISRQAHRNGVASDYSVRPLQPEWPHMQSTSGVFSMASHCVLQYLPLVVVQEQMGCAHFLPLVVSIFFLLD